MTLIVPKETPENGYIKSSVEEKITLQLYSIYTDIIWFNKSNSLGKCLTSSKNSVISAFPQAAAMWRGVHLS